MEEFYINENESRAFKLTGLALDELELVVGRFSKRSIRHGMLRGKIVLTIDGRVQIRKCFGSKLLWEIEVGS